jgi:ankyrin repeat protein
MVRLLIRFGADPNAGGGAALAAAKSAALVEALLDGGAIPQPSTWATLVKMAGAGEVDAVRLLLEAGADPCGESGGMTPLAAARAWEHGEVVSLLEQYGAADP